MYVDLKPKLTKQRLFNFFIGQRGDGKTTSARNTAVDLAEKAHQKGEPFEIAVIRRYKEETAKTKRGFFDGIERFGYLQEFKETNYGYSMDGEPFAYFMSLSTAARIKGQNYPNLRLIVFDEFLLDTSKYRYLPDEVNTFLSLYDTLARPTDPVRKPVTVIFLANAFSLVNPYFNFFHVTFPPGKNTFMSKEIYAEIIRDDEFTKHASSTRFGKLIQGTEYARHSIENEFILDDNGYIYKEFDKGLLLFNIFFNGVTYGVWMNWKKGTMYVCTKTDPYCTVNFYFTRDDMQPNYISAKRFKTTFQGKLTKDCYNTGSVYFDSIKTKHDFIEIARLANL